MQLTFLGATGTVTGSRYLLEIAGRRILVDCGLFQGYKALRLRNWAQPAFNVREIDAVVLTHAHIDHSGWLPVLVRLGYTGPIFCSAGTLELSRILLRDSAHLQEEEARYANRHGFSRHKPALPLYTVADAIRALDQFRVIEMGRPEPVCEGVSVELRRAGHLLGASFAQIRGEGLTITFTGDLGRPVDPVMHAPAAPGPTDYLVTESTYGDRRHPAIDPEAELGEWLSRAFGRGGTVVIPAFAVGRTQSLLLYLARLKERGVIPDVPVFMDSPMAIDATDLYRRFRREHRVSDADCERMCHAARLVNTPEESMALDRLGGPMIILSSSGMATGGRVVHHLKAFLGDARNLILFSGFQSPGTRGGALVRGAETIRIHGEEVPVKAEIGQLLASSSHADADELLDWMRQFPAPPRHTFVTHGEPGASDALRYRIEHELGWRVSVPEHRDVFDSATGEFRP
jgi:metallo-beta-lactamase family protein